ncbi:MAG TPA: SAV_6107 family HEPN domain-containing protein, partial [Mycobacteriales bacterium]|nr:SAV_6107 family HEPN domain-containing protein [Mycobacteriales bacterium]
WAALFAAGARRRAAAEAGVTGAATGAQADDLVADVGVFLALVETTLGLAPRLVSGPGGGTGARS